MSPNTKSNIYGQHSCNFLNRYFRFVIIQKINGINQKIDKLQGDLKKQQKESPEPERNRKNDPDQPENTIIPEILLNPYSPPVEEELTALLSAKLILRHLYRNRKKWFR